MKAMKLAFLLLLLAPCAAHAHRAWLLPSATVLSGTEGWVTVDAAVSNDLFYFEHHPLRLDGLTIIGPDGNKIEPQNANTGRFRSTFDAELKTPGTYRFAVNNNGLFAQYGLAGETKRWRGRPEELAKFKAELPAEAKDLKITQSQRRLEAFATLGKPDENALKPTGVGLELEPVTHPNDLVANEEARFKLLLDGKPVSNLEVVVVRGGIRYRDALDEMKVTTDAEGSFAVTFPEPGMYWFEASVMDDKPTLNEATQRRAGYAVTLEVLPE